MSQPDGTRDDAYRAVPDSDVAEERGSRHSLARAPDSAADGAAERLLSKELEARIVSADMPEAKYKAGDQRNGEAKIEIDAKKRTFTGLTKEELLKYQDVPFWVRLRWTMFVLFWALWFCMLAGAITIIVKSPKCDAPQKWYEQSPLLEMPETSTLQSIEKNLPLVQKAGLKGVVVPASMFGDIYDSNLQLHSFKELVAKAKDYGIKVIVDMTANYVRRTHDWFIWSERSEGNYTDYFTWAPGRADSQPPNNWVSTLNEPAWTYSSLRKAYYLHQFSADTADLNFRNPLVVKEFSQVLAKWIEAGAGGIRLLKAQQLMVDATLKDDPHGEAAAASHTEYEFYSHRATSDQAELVTVLRTWREVVEKQPDALLTTAVRALDRAPYVEGGLPVLPLLPAGPVSAEESPERLRVHLSRLLKYWPSVQFLSDKAAGQELAALSLLLPATPVLTWSQVFVQGVDDVVKVNRKFSELMTLRKHPALASASFNLTTDPQRSVLLLTRVLNKGVGYLGVYNPSRVDVTADASHLPSVPNTLKPFSVSNDTVISSNLTVPGATALVFVFQPVTKE